jgi:hypothetical protein
MLCPSGFGGVVQLATPFPVIDLYANDQTMFAASAEPH